MWASHAPGGLLASISAVFLLLRYSLAGLRIFVHLACQARWSLGCFLSQSAARAVSYSVMVSGLATRVVLVLAASGCI